MPALQIEGIARIILTSFSASGAPKSRDSNYRISCWRPAPQGLFTRLRRRIYKLTDDGRREGTEPYMFSAAMLPTSSSVRASRKPSEVTINLRDRWLECDRPFEPLVETGAERFLRVHMREGSEPFDKSKLSRFLESILPLKSTAV
jgi:hypothetical protein